MLNLSIFVNERINHFKKIYSLSITFFIYLFGWGLISPIFNIRINEITKNLYLSGIIFSLIAFISIILNPIIGRLCDKTNTKKILKYSTLLYSIVFLLYAYSSNFWHLLITAIIHSIAYAGLWVSGWSILRRITKGPHSQEELSFWTTIQNIAYLLAPLIGGLLISISSWLITYYIASGLSLLSFFYIKYKLNITPTKNKNLPKFNIKSFFKKNSTKRLTALTIITYLIGTGFGSYLTLKLKLDGFNIDKIGIIISITTIPYILFPIIMGIIADKYGRKIPTLIGLILISSGIYAMTSTISFISIIIYSFIIYTGFTFISTSINAELNDLLKMKNVGSFSGIYESIKNIGAVIGPLITGFISQITNINFAFIILSIMCIFSIIILKGFNDF